MIKLLSVHDSFCIHANCVPLRRSPQPQILSLLHCLPSAPKHFIFTETTNHTFCLLVGTPTGASALVGVRSCRRPRRQVPALVGVLANKYPLLLASSPTSTRATIKPFYCITSNRSSYDTLHILSCLPGALPALHFAYYRGSACLL